MTGRERIQLKELADQLMAKAGALAEEFKSYYSRADKHPNEKEAKRLSSKGRRIEEECRAINEQVREILKLVNSLPTPPRMILSNMPKEWRNAAIEALQALPMEHVCPEVIEEVVYGHYLSIDKKKSIQSPASVFFYKNDRPRLVLRRIEDCQIIEVKTMKRVIGDGIGRIVYRNILTDDERAAWCQLMDEIYESWVDPKLNFTQNEIDFAISYSSFFLEKEMMQKLFPEEFEFFQNLFAEFDEVGD